MSEEKKAPLFSECKTSGTLKDQGILIVEQSSIDSLSQRGYGSKENNAFTLTFYEALYLLDKNLLEVTDEKGDTLDFQNLLQQYKKVNENAWVDYLVYRDLRSRGYVARDGFGAGIAYRVYQRGAFGKDTAKYLVLSTQEGTPVPVKNLANAILQCQSQNKELVLAVMNRRGEVVYYSVSNLRF